jgi:hypothetical protein
MTPFVSFLALDNHNVAQQAHDCQAHDGLIVDSPTERGDNFSFCRFASRARTIIRAYSARASDDTLLHRLRAISAAVIAFFFIRMMIAGRCAVVKRMSPGRLSPMIRGFYEVDEVA